MSLRLKDLMISLLLGTLSFACSELTCHKGQIGSRHSNGVGHSYSYRILNAVEIWGRGRKIGQNAFFIMFVHALVDWPSFHFVRKMDVHILIEF